MVHDKEQNLGKGSTDAKAQKVAGAEFELVLSKGLCYYVDTKGSPLAEGESRVYPYHDEGADLLRIARSLDTQFDTVVDAFAGGGHSILPIVNAQTIAKRGYGIDLNPRAVRLAQTNAEANGLRSKVEFQEADVKDGLPRFEGRTLYIANPPFALPAQGVEMDRMRDGGHDGLHLTLAYIDRALIDTYVEEALHGAKSGDAIIGVAYSRIGINGNIELEDELRRLVGEGSSFAIGLVEGAKLWRGANGLKEQPNPMSLDQMYLKAESGPDYERQVEEYKAATIMHKEQGYDRLGYFGYVVRVGQKT